MRRKAVWAALLLVAALALYGQHSPEGREGGKGKTTEAKGEHGSLEGWKWANFLVLAGIIGWAVKKNAGPFFDARSREIRKAIVEAEEIRADAERRAADVDRRLANLGVEIEALRKEALAEEEAERERVRRDTAADQVKIRAQSEQEIVSAGKQARLELKRYSARLALALAEQKIRARMSPGTEDGLVEAFLQRLDHPSSRAQTN